MNHLSIFLSINVIGKRHKVAYVGDEIVCVVKKARSLDAAAAGAGGGAGAGAGGAGAAGGGATAANMMAKLKRGQVARAIVVRTKKETIRKDGSSIKFDDNACVMINKQGQPLGNRVLGAIAMETRQKRWAKIAALAPKIV